MNGRDARKNAVEAGIIHCSFGVVVCFNIFGYISIAHE